MQQNKIVSRDEWIDARKAHLAKEKALTRLRDELSAERRELPWVKVEKDYVFETPHGQRTLSELFDGRSQLIVKHFMLAPISPEGPQRERSQFQPHGLGAASRSLLLERPCERQRPVGRGARIGGKLLQLIARVIRRVPDTL